MSLFRKNKSLADNSEYRAYCQIAEGTSTENLRAAIKEYRTSLDSLSIIIGFFHRKESLHVKAFEDVLSKRDPNYIYTGN